MIPISIDISEVVNQLNVTKDTLQNISRVTLNGIVGEFVDELENHVNKNLKSTRSTYLRAIYRKEQGNNNVIVGLNPAYSLALMIEGGASSFDIKKNVLSSPKVKISKEGKKYISVPFRFATAEAIGESSVFSSKLPNAIKNIAKANFIQKKGGVRKGQLKNPFAERKINQISGYRHKHSIYEGVKRTKTTGENRGSYFSFRRISENSASNS